MIGLAYASYTQWSAMDTGAIIYLVMLGVILVAGGIGGFLVYKENQKNAKII